MNTGTESEVSSLKADQTYRPSAGSLLGEALTIREVAELLGCSPWTVRQKYLPQGLPHMRASAMGKIVFFRAQVTEWILKRQQQKKRVRDR